MPDMLCDRMEGQERGPGFSRLSALTCLPGPFLSRGWAKDEISPGFGVFGPLSQCLIYQYRTSIYFSFNPLQVYSFKKIASY